MNMGLAVMGVIILLFLVLALLKKKQPRPQSKLEWLMDLYAHFLCKPHKFKFYSYFLLLFRYSLVQLPPPVLSVAFL